jgi:tripartite-type tricarboxylate transporter receptor subunit TctC
MRKGVAAALMLAALVASQARADTVADFYRGRQINLIVGYGPGGGYDVYARLVGRHLGRYIPGQPTVVVQNMPGAGSLRAVNYLYNVAALERIEKAPPQLLDYLRKLFAESKG